MEIKGEKMKEALDGREEQEWNHAVLEMEYDRHREYEMEQEISREYESDGRPYWWEEEYCESEDDE